MRINSRFDGNKIKITKVRTTKDGWYGNAVHFQYEGKTYRASIREDPDSEDESGNRVRYAHLQIADANGNWGEDIATRDFVDEIPISINHLTTIARKNNCMRWSGREPYPFPTDCKYDRSIPYKFYDNIAFADYLNSIFVE